MKFFARIIVMALMFPVAVSAQEKPTGYVGGDVVSRYMWRGQDHGGFTVLPEASLSWQGIKLDVNGSAAFENSDYREINLGLHFSRWGFTIGATDYWQTGIDPNNRYFHIEKQGAHQLEGNIGYECKYFSLMANTIVWGNDFKVTGKQAYSTYIELGIPFRIGGVNWELKAGMTPFESAGTVTREEVQTVLGKVSYDKYDYEYADKVSCVMASLRATKEIDLGFAQLPVFAELHTNPYLQTANLLFGVTISPF